MRLLATVGTLSLAAVLAAQESRPASLPTRLRRVDIERRDVFTQEQADQNLLYALANALHGVTKEGVLRREVWLRPGDLVTQDQIDEVERSLRATAWLGAAEMKLQPVGAGESDLLVSTRDRLTLGAGVSMARVGGVSAYSAAVTETNLFGTGKQIAVAAHKSETDKEYLVRWIDPQLLDTWHRLSVEGGETEDGPFVRFGLTRPLKTRDEHWTYGLEGDFADTSRTYYSMGEQVAKLPELGQRMRLFGAFSDGPRECLTSLGADLRWRRSDWSAPTGSDPGFVTEPPDVEEVSFGPVLGIDYAPRYDKRTGLDSLDYVEDLKLGVEASLRLALSRRDEAGHGPTLEEVLAPHVAAAMSPWPDRYVTCALDSESRWNGGNAEGWNLAFALHAFECSLPRQTLAASFTYETAFEHEDAPRQLTLGEDNGLRGYPAREFAGSRVARLNLEDRISTGIEVLSFHVGAVAFCDVGWVHGAADGLSMSDPIKSVGIGLRFGSSHFFGSRVLRLDFAVPLDDVNGQSYGNSLSFSVGQVFGFFGNRSALERF